MASAGQLASIGPIRRAQQLLLQLAGGEARQCLDEVDATRAFDIGNPVAAEADQLTP
jgi:hypothetical protein